MNKSINKKGQGVDGLSTSIIALVVAVIVLVMGLIIIQELRDTNILVSETASFTNESVTSVNELGDKLVCGSQLASSCAVTLATYRNATGTFVLASPNYSVTNPGCSLAFAGSSSSAQFNNTHGWNVTYTCGFGGESYESANDSLVGLGDFSDFIPLIVLALAASLVIGLILAGFAFRGANR